MTNKALRTSTESLKPRRSRRGCRNCKLRKVKVSAFPLLASSLRLFVLIIYLHGQCDELRPHCQGCRSYGVLCNYDANVPELQLSTESQPQKLLGNGTLAAQKVSTVLCRNARVSILNTGAMRDFTVPFGLDPKRTRLLYHFRTCMAPSWRGARDGCLQLAHEVGGHYQPTVPHPLIALNIPTPVTIILTHHLRCAVITVGLSHR